MNSVPSVQFHQTDVAVVGGGPAGLATAIFLGRHGVHVTLIEKQSWPVDKVCGEGIMPTGVAVLQELGVVEKLSDLNRSEFAGIEYINENGSSAAARFSVGRGLGIRRTALSEALYTTAKETPGIQLYPAAALQALNYETDGITLTVEGKFTTTKIKAKILIGADGHHSTVRKLANIKTFSASRKTRWGTRQHFASSPWSEYVQIYWSEGVEAYVTPTGTTCVQIAFLWDKRRFQPSHGNAGVCAELLSRFPTLLKLLGDSKTLSTERSTGPMALSADQAVHNRVILIGDALGFVDGITGEGISVALQQAGYLGDVLPMLIKSSTVDTSLKTIGQQLKRMHDKGFRMCKPALLLAEYPGLRRRVVSGLSRSPNLFQHFLASNMGAVHPAKIPPGSVPCFLRGFLG